jgi:hypothetical protein
LLENIFSLHEFTLPSGNDNDWARSITPVIECLLIKCKTLRLILHIAKKKKVITTKQLDDLDSTNYFFPADVKILDQYSCT